MYHDVSSTAPICVSDTPRGAILRRAQIGADGSLETLRAALGNDLALVALFVSPAADFAHVVEHFTIPGADVVACTTAGEIGAKGYEAEIIVAVGFPRSHFATACVLMEDLNAIAPQDLADRVVRAGLDLSDRHRAFQSGFAMLLIDGLSLKEDVVTATLSPALGDFPLFGGSAGDGVKFGATRIGLNGRVHDNAAVLSLIRTDLETQVFSLDHLVPSDAQMVVTGADPDRRIVKTINAEPAAREYARIIGKDPEQLDELAFAAHPVVVRIGDAHHVRAIQRVDAAGHLVFFSAIDEGMVLTVAQARDMAGHLDAELSALAGPEGRHEIIGCDCLLRRLEAEQMQQSRVVSDVLARHRVIGFSTYGEQIGPLHVNHTMTGVAIYPPRG